jgi:Rieske Fe-S protein
MSSFTRRDVLGMASALLPVIACAPDVTDTTPPAVDAIPDDAVVITIDSVLVRVERIPALRAVDGAAVLLAARVIVVRTGADTFRALSAECPHSGCGVSVVDRPRLICPCHGSEFDFSGNRLAGPAPTGLRMLRADYDAAAGVLQVMRSIAPQLRPNSSRA